MPPIRVDTDGPLESKDPKILELHEQIPGRAYIEPSGGYMMPRLMAAPVKFMHGRPGWRPN